LKRIFLVAGESSGDTHGANLVRALRQSAPDLHCEGLGGEQMAAAGMELRHDLAGEGIMGFTEVVKHFRPIRRLFLDTVAHLRAQPPDALVLIDYPGFNIRLAKAAHALGIRVIYYISPQVWAWKKKRIHTIARCAQKMLVIFPFEEKLYREIGMECSYVGHPLLDHIEAYRQRLPGGETAAGEGDGAASEPPPDMLIGLLPGSREQEIARLLAPMIEVARALQADYPGARFVTPCVNARRAAQVRAIAGDFPLEVRVDAMYEVLGRARFCMVASGTATLETALFGVPFLILYKVTPITYQLARWLVDIEHIGIVNILAGRRVVPEFVQHEARPTRMLPVARGLIADTPARAEMLTELHAMRELLGGGGASERAAREILTSL